MCGAACLRCNRPRGILQWISWHIQYICYFHVVWPPHHSDIPWKSSIVEFNASFAVSSSLIHSTGSTALETGTLLHFSSFPLVFSETFLLTLQKSTFLIWFEFFAYRKSCTNPIYLAWLFPRMFYAFLSFCECDVMCMAMIFNGITSVCMIIIMLLGGNFHCVISNPHIRLTLSFLFFNDEMVACLIPLRSVPLRSLL